MRIKNQTSSHGPHSGASGIGLIAFIDRIRKAAEVFLFFFPPILGCFGVSRTTTGGCLVASHEMGGAGSDIPLGTRISPHRSNSSRSRRSSSEMRKLGALPLLSVMWLKVDGCDERKSPAGHEG